MNSRSGLALVELAIVLSIIGLLVGGVLVGQQLIRAGGMRAVSNEHQTYAAAVQNFRTKYGALPGDMRDATKFWGDNSAACSDAAITNGSPGTCNGDGDGTIEAASAASATGEMFQLWNQLSYGGLTGAYYTGTAGAGGAAHCVMGTNCPGSKHKGGTWAASYTGGLAAGDASTYSLEYGNYFLLGGQTTTGLPTTAILTPADAYSVDSKLDDGMPGTGSVIAYYRAACANAASVTDYASTYALTTNTAQCALYFVRQF